MKLISMAIKKDEKEEDEYKGAIAAGPQSKYGYGLCLYLDDDQCKALGLDRALPSGTLVKIEATGVVESTTERVDRDKDEETPEVSLNIQITNLAVEPNGTAAHPAELLYTNKSS